MKKLGEIGIEDIPIVTREDKFKTSLPLAQELCEQVQTTSYMEENEVTKIANNLFTKGGKVFFSQSANEEYGDNQVRIAYDYIGHLNDSLSVDKELKMAIISWIADNIFDLDKMSEKEEISEED